MSRKSVSSGMKKSACTLNIWKYLNQALVKVLSIQSIGPNWVGLVASKSLLMIGHWTILRHLSMILRESVRFKFP